MSGLRITWGAAALALVLLAGCGERPPVKTVQSGYRGTGMEQVYNPRIVQSQLPINQLPASSPAAPTAGPKARDVYQNVKVLGDLSVAEFSRHMAAITQWVSPEQGCNYCHNPQNFADDSVYTKVVSRRMIQMTQHLNADWKLHVAETGVTCYTCHRGLPVPQQVWFSAPAQPQKAAYMGNQAGQNRGDTAVNISSLPYDPFTPYLKGGEPIRVNSITALPTGNRASIKQAEHSYGLMMHMSTALGVNCTYCHNTRSLGSWDNAPPQRVAAYHGIRMTRDINNAYLEGLTASFPAQRLGPTGDVAKANCATCHQGAFKPLYGAQMAKDYAGLIGVRPGPGDAAPAAASTSDLTSGAAPAVASPGAATGTVEPAAAAATPNSTPAAAAAPASR